MGQFPDHKLQGRVWHWMMECFGAKISSDKTERVDRFIEEALELAQSVDYPRERVEALIDYTYGRPKGEPDQEVGGVMITLAALCLAHDLDMHDCGEVELARIWTKIDAIRAKQAAKPTGSALPMASPSRSLPAQQEWVCGISLMQQSVLFAAIRAPDGLRKDHPVKVIMRWYRRCVLLSAFDRAPILDPFSPGGGSFTGPFTMGHAIDMGLWRTDRDGHDSLFDVRKEAVFGCVRDVYLRHVDEMPHHFQLHLMHAAQIVGCHHPDDGIRNWWRVFYEMIVNDAHLFPESDEQMNARLSDSEAGWRAREQVTTK